MAAKADGHGALIDQVYKRKLAEAAADPRPAVPLAEGLARVRDRLYGQKLVEALTDPRPPIPAEEVFAEVRAAARERRARGWEWG